MNKQELIQKLNEDLAGEYGAIIQYITYAAKTTGLHRVALAEFFRSEIADELKHAQFLADKITALGGQPTTTPRPTPEAHSNREMLEQVLRAEKQAIADYTERARQADKIGDKGLVVALEDIVSDETSHAEETAKLLADSK